VQEFLIVRLLVDVDCNQDLQRFITGREFAHSDVMEGVPAEVVSGVQDELVSADDVSRVSSE